LENPAAHSQRARSGTIPLDPNEDEEKSDRVTQSRAIFVASIRDFLDRDGQSRMNERVLSPLLYNLVIIGQRVRV